MSDEFDEQAARHAASKTERIEIGGFIDGARWQHEQSRLRYAEGPIEVQTQLTAESARAEKLAEALNKIVRMSAGVSKPTDELLRYLGIQAPQIARDALAAYKKSGNV